MEKPHVFDPRRQTRAAFPTVIVRDERVRSPAYDSSHVGTAAESQLRLVGPELVYGTLFGRIGYDKVHPLYEDKVHVRMAADQDEEVEALLSAL